MGLRTAVRVFMLLFSFPIFSDRRSLKIENENNSMKVSYIRSEGPKDGFNSGKVNELQGSSH